MAEQKQDHSSLTAFFIIQLKSLIKEQCLWLSLDVFICCKAWQSKRPGIVMILIHALDGAIGYVMLLTSGVKYWI